MISVVIPLYNKQESVTRTINSVLAQTYSDFELIVINDGSTDQSVEVVRRIADPRIRIISQDNRGISAARNRGVEEACSDWIAFLDADDEWMPDFLATILDLHANFPDCGLVATGFLRKGPKGFDYDKFEKIGYPNHWKGIIKDYYTDLRVSVPFFPSSVAVRKSDLLKSGEFPVHMTRGQDIDTWIRLYQITDFAYYKYAGAIYHLDAENRAYRPYHTAFSKPTDYTIGDLLRHIDKESKFPHKERSSLVDLLAKYDLSIVRKLIQMGYRREALKRLWSFRTTTIYRRKAIKMLFASILPMQISVRLGWIRKISNDDV